MKIFLAGALAAVCTVISLASCSAPQSESFQVELSPVEPSQSSPSTVSPEARDEAAISVAIQSVATFADRGAFEGIIPLFSEEVIVDYTSLGAEAIETHTPKSLTAAWAGVLPGFDQTYHNLSNVQITINDNRADATADVTAEHYLDEGYWAVNGQYEYRFVKQSGQWQITHMTFSLIDEVGDRTLLLSASERATTGSAAED